MCINRTTEVDYSVSRKQFSERLDKKVIIDTDTVSVSIIIITFFQFSKMIFLYEHQRFECYNICLVIFKHLGREGISMH